jgi:hypothetical protein
VVVEANWWKKDLQAEQLALSTEDIEQIETITL